MSPESPNLSVVVPTLNEAENIEGIIAKIIAGGSTLEMEIIVVDDGSKDETQAIVRRLSETLPVILLARDKPKDGLAGAVLAGARASRAGVVLVIDADGSHPPEKIPELALPVIRGDRDMVIGSRYAPGGSTPGWSRKRRLMSRAASACAWPLTDVHDALSGFFAVRRELLTVIPSDAAGFKIALEILVRGGDSLRVGEAPIAFRDRELGQSKMGTRVILTYFRRLLALSGWRESQDSVNLALAKTLLVWVMDFGIFAAAWLLHAGLSTANMAAFAMGAALNAWLKTKQLATETRRSVPVLSRLLFVSLLAFFLRSGLLATCVRAFGWPWLAAIVPAIMIGWTVLFLGYALFIWPVRDQYGRGVRWRVAAMGATAYLLALRVAYLYTLPINRRLAVMPAVTGWLSIGDRLTLGLRHLGTMLLGPDRAGFNFPALLCWGAAAFAVFHTAQQVFDKTTAFRALLLFSVLPVYFWVGTVFGPGAFLVTGWAVLLWLMSFAIGPGRKGNALRCGVALVVFWFPGVWLPWLRPQGGEPLGTLLASAAGRAVLFWPWQLVLVTPVAIIAAVRYLARWFKEGPRADTYGMEAAAGVCAVAGGLVGWMIYAADGLDITVGGAMWLPLLPFIAAEMQRPGEPPARWWGAVIYGCILAYGIEFYWLAFGG